MAPPRTRESAYPPTGVVLVDISSTDHSFDPPLRKLSVGTAGTVKVDMPNATGITIPANALVVGVQHDLLITKIYKTGTSAAEMVGWF